MADDQIDRSRLPIADPEFTGVANRALAGSRPDWGLIGHAVPPEGAPNVLLVLIDDAGFGQPDPFGADRAPFAFTGTVKQVRFDIKPHLTAEDEHALHESAHHGHVAHGISA